MSESTTDSKFAAFMAQHEEKVTSPDGRILATVKGDAIKGLAFAPGTYSKYTETELEAQLVQLARLTWVARTRARHEGLKAAHGDRFDPGPKKATSSAERGLYESRDKAKVKVESANITITIAGGTKWAVQIKPGTLKRLDEAQFLRELATLVKRAMNSWRTTMSHLRTKAFGPSEILRDLRRSRRP